MSDYIQKIYSKIEPNLLLHQVIRREVFEEAKFRINACDNSQLLQLAILNLSKDQTFKPHRHIYRHVNEDQIPQECWVIISGKVMVYYWDIDNAKIGEYELHIGDITMTFEGGHTYKSLEDNTKVYEIKASKYYGVEKDKIFI